MGEDEAGQGERKVHEAVAAGPPADHNHYWGIVGHKGTRWSHKGHAVIKCVRCPAMSLAHYGEIGPCQHVVSRHQVEAVPMVLEWEKCILCGAVINEDGVCEGCGTPSEALS